MEMPVPGGAPYALCSPALARLFSSAASAEVRAACRHAGGGSADGLEHFTPVSE